MLTFLGLILWVSLPMLDAQTAPKIDPAKLPSVAAAARDFVPPGWTVEAQTKGDLNRDALPDLAVTLVEGLPANADKNNPPERNRALLVLLKTADGKFNRAGFSARLLLCTRCGGAFYGATETPVTVEITNGVLIVKQDYGSRELTQELYRFRHETDSNRFALIGMDLQSYDRLTGETMTESTNFLTGLKLTTSTKVHEKTGKEIVLSNKSRRVSRDKKYLEEFVAHDNGQEEK